MHSNRVLTDAFREIKKTMSRFLSLFLLSALAVAFLAGLRTTAPDMQRTADGYFDRQGLMDVHLLSTLGLTEEDIDFLARQPGIAAAEGSYTVDALLHLEQNDLILKLLSLSPTGINAPELLEGRLPQTATECVVEPKLLRDAELAIGDKITFNTGSGDFSDALVGQDFTIVGTVNSPLYISVERGSSSLGSGQVTAFAMLLPQAFSMDFYTDGYLVAAHTAALQCYDDEYEDHMEALIDTLEPLGDLRAGLRYDQVIGEANDKLAEAQQEFDDGERDAKTELDDAAQTLADARIELDDGWAEYQDGKATLRRETADAKQELLDGEADLITAKADLDQGELDYADGVKTLADGKIEYEDGLKTWQDGVAEYEENRQKLVDGEQEYQDGLTEYQDGLSALQDGAGQLSLAKKQLDDAKKQLDAGDADLAAGQAQYNTLAGGYAGLQQAIPSDPATLAGVLGAMDAQAAGGYYRMAVLPLQQILQGLLPSITDPGMQQQVQGLLLTFPADSTAFVTAPTAYAPALLGGMGVVGGTLPALKAALDSGGASLSYGYDQYLDGKKEYTEGKQKLDDSILELQDAQQKLQDAKAELVDGWAKLADGKRELDDGRKELEDAALSLASGEAEVVAARKKLDDGWVEYHDGLVELADGKAKLPRETRKAQKKLDDAFLELQDGEEEYADGLVEYADGKREADEKLSDARKKLNDARRDIADIEHCEWYVLGRNTNVGYVSFQQDAERMGNLANVFPLIFFLVAALVCLTTMTRMVEEQRVQIGGMKALGYGKGAIALKYVGYGLLSSLLGSAAGLALGCTLIPWVIFNAWKILYTVGELTIPFYPGISLIATLAAVICVTGTAFATCYAALTASPASLMRPRTPKPGKRVLLERVPLLWNRLSFTWKVTVRNLFRYKKRFWMTVVGIGGCTALIVSGFGLRNSLFDILDIQFDQISTYSSQVGLADDVTEDELAELQYTLDGTENVTDWMLCHQTSLSMESPHRSMDAYLVAVEDAADLEGFIHLRHRTDSAPVVLPAQGAVITEKLADMLQVGVGDTLTLDGDKRVEVTIADITENYVLHYLYLSADYYAQLFGAPPTQNMVFARYGDDSDAAADAVSAKLIALSGVSSVGLIRDSRETFTTSMESVDYGVLVIIVAAAALAFVVLYNLTNINITERMRELATLKVLGFYNGELSAYVYRENVFLTLFGILMGLVMGKFLHRWLVLTVEIDMVMFGRTARPSSYLLAIALTALFSLLVNLAARRKLRKIDMVESLKTVE